MKISGPQTKRSRTSVTVPSVLGFRRRQSTESSSTLQPLVRSQTAPDKIQTFTCPQQTAIDPKHWQLPSRTRRLSTPLPETEDGAEQARKTEGQMQSLLFRLPKDVRTRVYKLAIANNVFHIVRRRDRLGHRTCKSNSEATMCTAAHCRGSKFGWGLHTGAGDGGLIQLLQSCRKIYSEAISILYAHNTFYFDSLETFLAFSVAIIPSRFDSIRSLQLDFQFSAAGQYAESHPDNNMPRWERTWRVIATIRDLEEIRMKLDWPRGVLSKKELVAGRELELLRPLLLVGELKRFDVILPKLSGKGDGDVEGLPFSVERYERVEGGDRS